MGIEQRSIPPSTRLSSWLETLPAAPPTFPLQPITENKLIKLVKKMKPSKALPSDMVDARSLKLVAPLLIPTILHIVNFSISSHTFAQPWKMQIILPYPKKNDRDDVNNYRLVSNLVEVSKLTEAAVY